MLTEIMDVLTQPEAYVCIWRDGEIYLEPVSELFVPANEVDAPLAA